VVMDTNWSGDVSAEYLSYRFTYFGETLKEDKILIPWCFLQRLQTVRRESGPPQGFLHWVRQKANDGAFLTIPSPLTNSSLTTCG